MRTALSSLALLLSPFADAAPTTLFDRRRQLLSASVAECEHGFDGMLIEMDKATLRSAATSPMDSLLGKLDSVPGTKEVMFKLPSINTVAARLSESGVEMLLRDPEVKSVTANCIIQLDPTENTGVVSQGVSEALSWGLDRIDSRRGTDDKYDDSGATGANALVYVLDTGVRTSHEDFGGRALPGWSSGCPTGNENACGNDRNGYLYQGVITPEDSRCNGHGTHCASTAGGVEYGVAKGVAIVTVQVLSCQGSGTLAGVSAGIEWAVRDAKAKGKPAVLSMSLGGGGGGHFDDVINAAWSEGVITVVAAGNSNANACNYSPASTALAVTVGSTDENNDRRSDFSNHGRCVDIHAPGRDITAAWSSSDTATTTISGTSMACPHVAGVAAQLRALNPSMGPKEITDTLICLSTKDAITRLPGGTANTFLYNDVDGPDAADCGLSTSPRAPPSPPSPPSPNSPPPSPGALPDPAAFVGLFQQPSNNGGGKGSGKGYDGRLTWTAAVRERYSGGFSSAEGALSELNKMLGGKRGVQVLDGGYKKSPATTCIDPASDVTAIEGRTIAAQCCEKNTCRRYVDGQNNEEGCIAGYARRKPPNEMTYAENQAKCADLGLEMCQKNCFNQGCLYNNWPVYTSLPCNLSP